MCRPLGRSVAFSIVPLLASGLMGPGALAAEEFSLNTRTELVHNRVTGTGAASSFLDTGTHLFHESEIYRAARLDNGWTSTLNTTLRLTDSKQFDANKASLQMLEFRLNDRSKDITVGDYFANLSPYAMNKAIKGLGVQANLGGDQTYLRATVGTFDGQWAYLLGSARSDEPMDRAGAGLRYQRQTGPWTYGANLATVWDRQGDPRRAAGESAWRQTVPALDWEYRADGFTLAGEHAYSFSDELTAAGPTVDSKGAANKLTARAMLGVINLDGRLERVGSDFKTLAGGATPDRQQAALRVNATISRLWKTFANVDYSHNNLDGHLANRTSNTSYELGVTKRRAFDRKTLTLSTSLRQRITDTHSANNDQTTDRIKFKLTDTWAGLDVRGDVETIIDKRQGAAKANDNLFNLGLSSRHEWGPWTFMPNLEFGNEERDNTAGGNDVVRTARVSLVADRGDGTLLGLNFDKNNSNTPVPNTDARVARWVAYWQLRPALLGKGSLKFELAFNDYQFELKAGDYREQIARVMVTWPLNLLSGR